MDNKSKRNVYHVTSNLEKGWKAKKEGTSRAPGYFDNKADAVERGKEPANGVEREQVFYDYNHH